MATANDLRRMALALEGTTEAPHFDRTAFKVARIYVTLSADGKTANFKLTPDEQDFKCMMLPEAFSRIPNAWGQQGWTAARLTGLSRADLEAALDMAWRHALPRKPGRSARDPQHIAPHGTSSQGRGTRRQGVARNSTRRSS
jgi:YjbR protein